MIEVTDEQFEKLVANAIDALPNKYLKLLNNVAIVAGDEPTPDQKRKAGIPQNFSLFGLYEGIPRTKRTNNYSGVLPDKITIFKGPSTRAVHTLAQLEHLVNNTVWHEVAHHYGLDHDRIHGLEDRS